MKPSRSETATPSALRGGVRGRTVAELRALQRLAGAAIMRELSPAWRTRSKWIDGTPMRRVAESFIKPNDRLTSLERLELYNRQYWFRVLDSLHDDFPGLRNILGTPAFTRMCRAYLTKHPSRSFTLRNLGCRLEQFLAESPEFGGRNPRLAVEAARFEWAEVVAFDEGGLPPVAIDDLLGRDPARLRLRLQPYVTVLELGHGVDEYLLALKKDMAERATASQAVTKRAGAPRRRAVPRPRRERVFVAVHRLENSVYYKRLDPVAFRLIVALRDGRTLAKACELALDASVTADTDWASQFQEWFRQWTTMGWFALR